MKDISILSAAGADIPKSLELLGDMNTYDETLNNLNKYKSVNDMANYAIDVHSLKSDVRYLGFMALGDMAYELELLSKSNDLIGVSSKHDALINEVKKVVSACKSYMYGSEVKEEMQTEEEFNLDEQLDPMSEALLYQGIMGTKAKTDSKPEGGTILIVDDSQIVANFIKKVFDNEYEVVICKDGQGAIDYCHSDEKRSKIKACLLDLNMPNVNGFEVLDFFKENNYFVKLPVVVISGVEEMDLIEKAKTYPIVEVLAKPFNERDLEMALHRCLSTYF